MFTSEQVRAARAMLRIEQRDLAEWSGVSLETIKRIERIPGEVSAYASTVDAIRTALEAAGIEFINGEKPGVRLRPGVKPPAKKTVAKKTTAAKKAKPVAKSRRKPPTYGGRADRRAGFVNALAMPA
jgi:DNA-binding XRE family transcriptional regulator